MSSSRPLPLPCRPTKQPSLRHFCSPQPQDLRYGDWYLLLLQVLLLPPQSLPGVSYQARNLLRYALPLAPPDDLRHPKYSRAEKSCLRRLQHWAQRHRRSSRSSRAVKPPSFDKLLCSSSANVCRHRANCSRLTHRCCRQWMQELEARTKPLAVLSKKWTYSAREGDDEGEVETWAFRHALRDGYVLCQ